MSMEVEAAQNGLDETNDFKKRLSHTYLFHSGDTKSSRREEI